MSQKFALRVEEAIVKSREHARAVIAALPKKPLHEIPFRHILLVAAGVLRRHPAFRKIDIGNPEPTVSPVKDGKVQYSPYEIGNNLLIERVAGQVVVEHKLNREQGKTLKTALGRLWYNPPASVFNNQENAFDKLEQQLGAEKVNALVQRSAELWREQAIQLRAAYRELSRDEEKQVNPVLGDMLQNPLTHLVFVGIDFNKLASRDISPLEAVKFRLAKLKADHVPARAWYDE